MIKARLGGMFLSQKNHYDAIWCALEYIIILQTFTLYKDIVARCNLLRFMSTIKSRFKKSQTPSFI